MENGSGYRVTVHCSLRFAQVLPSADHFFKSCAINNILSPSQVGDLQHASPATVSRCGMVFVDPKNLRYTPYWQRWVATGHSKVWLKKDLIIATSDTCITSANVLSFLEAKTSQRIVWKICAQLNWHDFGRHHWWKTGQKVENHCSPDWSEHGRLNSVMFKSLQHH